MKDDRRFTITAVCVIVIGLGCVVFLSRWMDQRKPALDTAAEEQLYINAETAKRISVGFNGLMADWYWLRSLQYVGRKIIDSHTADPLDKLGSFNLTLLPPLLETSTSLDPQFLAPYEYAAMVLPAIDKAAAIRITKKGIAANPKAWQLYHYLGFIYWQGRDFKAASETYGEGAALPGAPRWMEAMKAQLAAQGGSRNTALEIYERMYQESDDPSLKEMARRRILQIQSLNERDVIRLILSEFSARAQRCASSWLEVSDALRKARVRLDASGAPLDPADTPYQLNKTGCDVELDPRSQIPRD
jgi:hypothetical protein